MRVQETPVSVRMLRPDNTGARTSSARDVNPISRITVVSIHAPITIMSFCVISTVDTRAGVRLADVSVTVAFTPLAVREIPEAGLALVAFAAVSVWPALTLTRCGVAEVIESADTITIAGCKL